MRNGSKLSTEAPRSPLIAPSFFPNWSAERAPLLSPFIIYEQGKQNSIDMKEQNETR